jgi:CyaY protein
MDEARYLSLAGAAFSRIEKAVDQLDADVVDLDSGGDVLTLTCKNGTRVVVNTQRPVQQIWLAGAGRAWHFGFSEGRWIDARREDAELFATLSGLLLEHAGVALPSVASSGAA